MRNSDEVQTRGLIKGKYIHQSNTGENKQYTMKEQRNCNIAGWLYGSFHGPKSIEGAT